jgi:hypothetical protein
MRLWNVIYLLMMMTAAAEKEWFQDANIAVWSSAIRHNMLSFAPKVSFSSINFFEPVLIFSSSF